MGEVRVARSRRDLITMAAGAGTLALTGSLWRAESASAADPNDVVLGAANATGTPTSITNTGAGDAFTGVGTSGAGVVGQGAGRPGVVATSSSVAGLVSWFGDGSGAAAEAETAYTGVYGYSPASPSPDTIVGVGVWGESPDIGVFGNGDVGVSGYGGYGVLGSAAGTGGRGVVAHAENTGQLALEVLGRVRLSRSGRTTIGAGRSSRVVTLAGVTSSSLVFASLASNRGGRYVRAVVPAAGKFTIYLNTTVSSTTYVAWFVLN